MSTPTYKEQFDKITEAYIKGEIRPYHSNFCFCGTLAPDVYSERGYKNWNNHDLLFDQRQHFYTLKEYTEMERALFEELGAFGGIIPGKTCSMTCEPITPENEGYEDALFSGMVAALEVLKQIHIERGELIDETPVFVKRQLITHA